MRGSGVDNFLTSIRKPKPALRVILALTLFAVPTLATASLDEQVLERLDRLEREQAALVSALAQRDERIRQLEAKLDVSPEQTSSRTEIPQEELGQLGERESLVPSSGESPDDSSFGIFQPGGAGFKLADTPWGDVNFSAWSYARYLNQTALDETYTDAFGRTRAIDARNDVQLNKVNLYFKGWVYDPRFRYLLYTWTANTSQGDPAQVVVAGNLNYRFSDALDVGVGIGALPGTRTLMGNFPYWLKVDSRPIAEEFFRPSYTSGIWASGEIAENLTYRLMIGDNLSQLGVSALQLDDSFDTVSGALTWTPQGDYGPVDGYGDFEYHDQLATMFGVHATRSRENRQSQPGEEDIQNSQIRLSDGTVIFQPDAFATGGRINEATYVMTSADAGVKYRGLSLEGEYYWRWVSDFDVEGVIPVDKLFDHGFQLQASAMVLPRTLQTYLATSKIFGEYGNPWDLSLGINWFPFKERLLRVNAEALYLRNSPVGYSSIPATVGGNGVVFHTNVEMMF